MVEKDGQTVQLFHKKLKEIQDSISINLEESELNILHDKLLIKKVLHAQVGKPVKQYKKMVLGKDSTQAGVLALDFRTGLKASEESKKRGVMK